MSNLTSFIFFSSKLLLLSSILTLSILLSCEAVSDVPKRPAKFNKTKSEIKIELDRCRHVFQKFEERYDGWKKMQKFHGVSLGKFETEIDDDDLRGMTYFVKNVTESEDDIPYYMAQCRATVIETGMPTAACSDVEINGQESGDFVGSGGMAVKVGTKTMTLGAFVHSTRNNGAIVGITSGFCTDNGMKVASHTLTGNISYKSLRLGDCSVIEWDDNIEDKVKQGHVLGFDKPILGTLEGPNVEDVVFKYGAASKLTKGEIYSIIYRGDIEDGPEVYHYYLVKSLPGDKGDVSAFCEAGDAGSLVLRLNKSGDGYLVVGMVSACYLDGPFKGSALIAPWKKIEKNCHVQIQATSQKAPKDEL